MEDFFIVIKDILLILSPIVVAVISYKSNKKQEKKYD